MSGKIDYTGKLILAPMVRIGTLPTRLLALDYGADLVYTEEIIDWRLLRSKRVVNPAIGTVDYIDESDDTLVLRLSPEREKGHLVLQIGTCDPNRAVKVAKMVAQDVDAIDVNMGCPKAFSLKGGMGAALMTQPKKVEAILTSLVKAVDIPVTCKIRVFNDVQKTLDLIDVRVGLRILFNSMCSSFDLGYPTHRRVGRCRSWKDERAEAQPRKQR